MLLTNATIWPMEGEDISRGYLRAVEGKIEALGPMEECPRAAENEETMDLGGRLLLPGFIDTHSHLGLYSSGLGIEGDDINEDADPITPHVRAIDGIDPFDTAFAEARSSGVTCAVVSPGSANPIAGQICAVKTVGSWVDSMAVAQPLAIKFSLGENPKMTYGVKPQSPVTRMGTAALIREMLHKAGRYLQDCVRAQEDEDFDLPEYDARCEALLPLLRGEIAAHIHAHKAYDILTALRLAEEFGFRFVIVHGTEGHLIADILAQQQVDVICGPLICARTKPELQNLHTENCVRLIREGVSVAISTDHPEVPTDYLLMSASVAHSAGMELRTALESITISAARVAGLDERIGSLCPGKDADLLVFSQDLMKVGAHPDMVFIDGVWVK